MAERVSGPYRGYFISASARFVPAQDQALRAGGREGLYVGSVSLSERGPDDPHRMETLVYVERAGRAYVDRLLDKP